MINSLKKIIELLKSFELIHQKILFNYVAGEPMFDDTTSNLVCLYYVEIRGKLDQIYQELNYESNCNPCPDFMPAIHQFYENFNIICAFDTFSAMTYLLQRIRFFSYWISKINKPQLVIHAAK
jgi:hypothetical protein